VIFRSVELASLAGRNTKKNRHAFEQEWRSRQRLSTCRQSRVCEKRNQEKRWQVFEITTRQALFQSFQRVACMAASRVPNIFIKNNQTETKHRLTQTLFPTIFCFSCSAHEFFFGCLSFFSPSFSHLSLSLSRSVTWYNSQSLFVTIFQPPSPIC